MAAALTPPPDVARFRRRFGAVAALRETWQARPLIRALAERDIRAAYKQAWLGVAWAVVTPVMLMVVFTFFFQKVATVETFGAPYALFSFIALVPWNFFTSSMTSGGLALVNQMTLVNKINCPRETFPLASVSVAAFNAVIGLAVLALLFVINRYAPAVTTPLAILPLLVQLMFTVACVLALSSVTVYLRDMRHLLPIVLQIGLFVTPIAYSLDAIAKNLPSWLVPIYVIVNPMAACLDGYRQTVLYGNMPNWGQLGLAALSSAVLLYGSLRLFRRLETSFADAA
jgi:ABC-type polysaccharide/polyol phosphate export permease